MILDNLPWRIQVPLPLLAPCILEGDGGEVNPSVTPQIYSGLIQNWASRSRMEQQYLNGHVSSSIQRPQLEIGISTHLGHIYELSQGCLCNRYTLADVGTLLTFCSDKSVVFGLQNIF